jgi:hypothetical protein
MHTTNWAWIRSGEKIGADEMDYYPITNPCRRFTAGSGGR